MVESYISVQQQDFDVAAELATARNQCDGAGAVVSFVGIVRDSNPAGAVLGLELEHYPGMTETALQRIVDRAAERWQLSCVRVIHRFGQLLPDDQIVLVITASAHRADAFAACECIMDQLKTQAPFWKKEQTATGSAWVESRESDEAAAARWHGD